MSFEVGKYGIESDPDRQEDDASGLGWIVVVVLLAAAVSLVWTIVSRSVRRADDVPETPPAAAEVAQPG
ncbi:MAG: hypothetical protein IJI73_05390, partial [Kiritimatiellae bacterium]|nr:hypothetical protein [Kiritimatiellia bacterium]